MHLLRFGRGRIVEVRMGRPDRTRDPIDLVPAPVNAPRLVEHAIFGEDLVDGRAPTRGVVFTEDVVQIAGEQGRYAVGHNGVSSSYCKLSSAWLGEWAPSNITSAPLAGWGSASTDGYLLGSYRIATAPEPNSSRLTSFKSTRFDSPANNVGPWPASLGCTTNSYSSINPSSANASGSFTPPTSSPFPDSRLSC